MKKIKLIYALFLCFLIGILTGCTNNHTTIKEKIDKTNYVTIELPSTLHMDLSGKRWYGNGHAIRKDMDYTYEGTYSTTNGGFNYYKDIYLLYPIIADKTTVEEVKKSNYVIVKDVKNNSKQKKLMQFLHDYGFKGYKVKIFYNHDCLPIKVQLIDRETNKWKTITKYSYPHISSKQYEKNWKNYVKEVKEGYFLD